MSDSLEMEVTFVKDWQAMPAPSAPTGKPSARRVAKLRRFLGHQWLMGDAAVLSSFRELNDDDLWHDYGHWTNEDFYKNFR